MSRQRLKIEIFSGQDDKVFDPSDAGTGCVQTTFTIQRPARRDAGCLCVSPFGARITGDITTRPNIARRLPPRRLPTARATLATRQPKTLHPTIDWRTVPRSIVPSGDCLQSKRLLRIRCCPPAAPGCGVRLELSKRDAGTEHPMSKRGRALGRSCFAIPRARSTAQIARKGDSLALP
jgi:hypothetical protein